MDLATYNAAFCPVTKTIELIGGKWKPIILYLIEQEENRFGRLKRRMPEVSKKVLTQHLRELEQDGLISRQVQVSQAPQVVVYHLTAKGAALRRVIEDIFKWGAVYLLGSDIQAT